MMAEIEVKARVPPQHALAHIRTVAASLVHPPFGCSLAAVASRVPRSVGATSIFEYWSIVAMPVI